MHDCVMRRHASSLTAAVLATLAVAGGATALANTSHAGWPRINGMLLMNKLDQSRPLDARPGNDPFAGTDPLYRCDGLHQDSSCVGLPRHCHRRERCKHAVLVADVARHNELLGGHGDDLIHAGPWGDVLWGDYKPGGQPEDQRDRLAGGPGKDFIYASHGTNVISSGGGADVIHAHFGRGSISCSDTTTLFLSHVSRKRYRLHGCGTISYRTLGY